MESKKKKKNHYSYTTTKAPRPYTELTNGTAIKLNSKVFWILEDAVLRKTKETEITREEIERQCFKINYGNFSCYHEKYGNLTDNNMYRSSVQHKKGRRRRRKQGERRIKRW